MTDDGNPRFNTRWTGRTDLLMHEVAEALGVPTDRIMAAMPRDGFVTVLFNPDEFDMATHLWSALLRVGKDGTLTEAERRDTGKSFAEIQDEIGERLEDKLGPPPDDA